jgi:two-component system, NarL family, response regulator LiaR
MTESQSKPLRIAIIEDDPLMQLGLKHALGRHPQFEIIAHAEDGYAGVQIVLDLKPDLVIMGYRLTRSKWHSRNPENQVGLPRDSDFSANFP